MTDVLNFIRVTKTTLANAEADLEKAVRDGIKAGLTQAFENPEVENVAFGVSTQPYNDENMGCGEYGPVVNAIDGEIDAYHEFYNLFGYNSKAGGGNEVQLLRDVLKAAGWQVAGPALGLSTAEGESYGGQEVLFVAERSPDAPGGYLLTEHAQGEY